MSTMLITVNATRQNGNFMGDQLCALKTAYLFVQNQPDVDSVIVTMSPENEMHFVWEKFIDDPRGDKGVPPARVVFDNWDPGDWSARFGAWDAWRRDREIEGIPFDHYRELYLRIHGGIRQAVLCGGERGLGRRNIYEYWLAGQENRPDTFPGADWYDDTLAYHPPLTRERDVYIAPHCKTQGNYTFTFDYWSQVVHRLIDAGVTVTVGYDGVFCEDLNDHHLYKRHWGTHKEWFKEVCRHKIVACGNTGTGWVAAACGVPLFTMEPPNSQMPDHRYRECGLRNIVEVMDTPNAEYCARRLVEEVRRKVVMTTGCYDVLHAGHVRHLEKARSMGTRLIVALNSDESVKALKGPSRPINPQGQRKAVLEALRCVDEVRIFDGPDARALISEIKPDILACGHGYTTATIVGRDLVESWNGHVAVTFDADAKDTAGISTTKILDTVLRSGDIIEICRVATAYSVNPFAKLKLIADLAVGVLGRHVRGDVADCGSCRGGSALVLRKVMPGRYLHLFDTWEGTPYDDPKCHHKKGEWKVGLKDCQEVVGMYNLTSYYPGVFPQSVPDYLKEEDIKFCFVYVDMDTYQATHDALAFFWPRLAEGGMILLDDYGWEPCAGVKDAVDEFVTRPSVAVDRPAKRILDAQNAYILEKR